MAEHMVNGKKLQITPSSFKNCMALKNAVFRALNTSGANIGGIIDADPEAVKRDGLTAIRDGSIAPLVKAILAVAGDTEVEALLMECAKKAVIGQMSEKIDADYFEIEANRADYFPVMYHVLEENLGPFFKGAFSMFNAGPQAATGKGR